MKRKIDLIFIIIASIFGGMIGYNETDIFAKPERKTSATEISEVKLPVLFDPVGKFQLNVDMNKQHIAFTGDNIEIGLSDDNITYTNGIGVLKNDYEYQADNPDTDEDERKFIPAGSVIITGEYRGNPAFNVPLVLNEKEQLLDLFF